MHTRLPLLNSPILLSSTSQNTSLEMKCRCCKPLFYNIKADLGQGQLGLMRWNILETYHRAASIARPCSALVLNHGSTQYTYLFIICYAQRKSYSTRRLIYKTCFLTIPKRSHKEQAIVLSLHLPNTSNHQHILCIRQKKRHTRLTDQLRCTFVKSTWYKAHGNKWRANENKLDNYKLPSFFITLPIW